MSIHKVDRGNGRSSYRVRWRDDGGRLKSRTFERKRDAEAYEAKVKLAKRRGELEDLDAGRQRLEDFAQEWFSNYAQPRLAAATLVHYAGLRDRYILPRLGKVELRKIRPEAVQKFQASLAAQGVGAATGRKTLALLQGMLERAVEWGRISSNPVRVVKKPKQGRTRVVRAVPPAVVEKLRGKLNTRDAAFVSVLAYAGLRPGEALALTWADVSDQTLIVEKALALGKTKQTKTGQTRSVRLLKPLASDLNEWRMASGRPADAQPIFPMRDGRYWTATAYRNWRRKVFVPAAKGVGIKTPRPYDLRHSFASLLFQEGTNPAEIAEQMGHSVQTLLGTYTHVMDELRGKQRRAADALIRAERVQSVPRKFPRVGSAGSTKDS